MNFKISFILPAILSLNVIGCVSKTPISENGGPDCSSGWPLKMAFAKLKNNGVYKSTDWNSDKIESKRLFSTKEGDRFKQMYKVTFDFNKKTTVFVTHFADNTECSLTEPEVYVVTPLK
jgi:hypothetical protein